MNNTIANILTSLEKAISTEIVSANMRATNAELAFSSLRDGLVKLVGPIANDDDEGEGSEADVSASRCVRPSSSNLLRFLDANWKSASDLRDALNRNGINPAEGTVYNWFRRLAVENPRQIEVAVKPERWRLKSRMQRGEPLKVYPHSTKKPLMASASPKLDHVAGELNGNTVPPHAPRIHHGNCLEVLGTVASNSVDLILADLPYGKTLCDGDVQLPLDGLWKEYRRILKPFGTVALFASQPFTTDLVNSNREWFKYGLIWEKDRPSGFLNAANLPMKSHEEILVFSPGTTGHASQSSRRMTYNPQGVSTVGLKRVKARRDKIRYLGKDRFHAEGLEYEARSGFPRSILRFPKDTEHHHPFQKPLALLEYLIATYSNEGEMVLDNTMGSGSTCVAAMNTNRRSIGIELKKEWFDVAKVRIEKYKSTHRSLRPVSNSKLVASSVASSPKIKRSDVTLYQGDCLEVMRGISSGSVDMVFTSPPYNLGASSGGGFKTGPHSLWRNAALANGYASYDDARDPEEYIEWQKNILKECWRLLRNDGAIFYNHKPRVQNGLLQTPLDLNPGLPVRQIIIWNRNQGFNFNRSFFLPCHEWIVVFAKPDFRLRKGGCAAKDVWTIGPERNNSHPAPFPIELPRRAIENTNAKVILDPFCGSGTTGVAALECGRQFVGIELDGGYLEHAHARIKDRFMLEAA